MEGVHCGLDTVHSSVGKYLLFSVDHWLVLVIVCHAYGNYVSNLFIQYYCFLCVGHGKAAVIYVGEDLDGFWLCITCFIY